MLVGLMLVGCGLFSGEAPGDGGAGAPPAPPNAAPGATEVAVVPPRPPGCHHFFSEPDANVAFAVVGDTETDCAFEGIRVSGSELIVRFKPTPESEVAITLMNASCAGEGTVSGGLRVHPSPEATRACPAAVAAVRALAASGSLPVGEEGAYGVD